MNGAPPGDDELHGFLDGEIEPDRRRAIEAFLKTSRVHAERVEGWRRQQQIIRAVFAPVEAEPPPASILLPPPASRQSCLRLLRPCVEPSAGNLQPPAKGPSFRRKAADAAVRASRTCARPLFLFAVFAAGAIAALAGAFVADRLRAPPAASDIRATASVSSDDILAARTVAALRAFKQPERVNASDGASQKPGSVANQASLIVPNLSSVGFTLVGMRTALAANSKPDDQMFCVFYASAKEPAVALCMARDPDGVGPGGFHVAERTAPDYSDGAISWRQANAIYTLAGPLGEAELGSLANRVSAEIEAFD